MRPTSTLLSHAISNRITLTENVLQPHHPITLKKLSNQADNSTIHMKATTTTRNQRDSKRGIREDDNATKAPIPTNTQSKQNSKKLSLQDFSYTNMSGEARTPHTKDVADHSPRPCAATVAQRGAVNIEGRPPIRRSTPRNPAGIGASNRSTTQDSKHRSSIMQDHLPRLFNTIKNKTAAAAPKEPSMNEKGRAISARHRREPICKGRGREERRSKRQSEVAPNSARVLTITEAMESRFRPNGAELAKSTHRDPAVSKLSRNRNRGQQGLPRKEPDLLRDSSFPNPSPGHNIITIITLMKQPIITTSNRKVAINRIF